MKTTMISTRSVTVVTVDESCGHGMIRLPTKEYAELLLLQEEFFAKQKELAKKLAEVNPDLAYSLGLV